MGLMQRQKGKRAERQVADLFRGVFPDATIHRSSQADRAYEADICISGPVPNDVARLWIEVHDARRPNVRAKLMQAEQDAALHGGGETRLPVVVWKRTGTRAWFCTMQDHVYQWLMFGEDVGGSHAHDIPVTVDLSDFLCVLSEDWLP